MQSVCFTGACPGMTRDELSAKASEKFEVRAGATKDLDILVCADPNAGSAKLEKARKNGTRVIGYDEFLKMLDSEGESGGESGGEDEILTIKDGILTRCAKNSSGVREIGQGAFENCGKLKSIVIPEGVEKIGGGESEGPDDGESGKKQSVCFTGECYEMTRAELAERARRKFDVRTGVTKDLDILVCEDPNSGSAKIEKAKQNGTKIISYDDFFGMIDEIYWDGVFYIKNGVLMKFHDEKTENAVIPDFVTEISSNAFLLCQKLKSLEIPGSVKTIDSQTFFTCSFESVVIHEGTDTIEYHAFKGCDSLKSIALPASLKEICRDAFSGCSSLTEIKFGGTMAQWEAVVGLRHLLTFVPAKSVKCSDGEWQKPVFLARDGVVQSCVDKNATSVEISGAKRVGQYSFSECESLSSVVIGEGVTEIGEGAFEDCKALSYIEIPSTVTKIDKNAFAGCENVGKVVSASPLFPFNEKTRKLYDATGKSKKAILTLMAAKEDAKKEKIEKVQNVSASTVLESIMGEHKTNAEVIRDDKNAYLRIETSDGGFELLLADSKVSAWMKNLPAFLDLVATGADSFALKKFADENGLEDSAKKYVTLSKDGSVKWKKKTEPVYLFIPSGVTKIAEEGFENCDSLKFAVIPEGVTEISDYAFQWCESLEQVVLPDSLTEIGHSAFDGCKSLKSVSIPPNVKEISWYSFDCCHSLKKFVIPEGVEEIGCVALSWCNSLKSINLPSTIRKIVGGAFENCKSLSEISYNGTTAQWKTVMKSRGWNQNIPAEVVKCTDGEASIKINIEKVETETYTLRIADKGLQRCKCTSKAKKVVIPDGVTLIEYDTFTTGKCSAIETLEIPASMGEFGSYALNGCSSLTEIIFRGTIEQWNAIEKLNDWHKDVPARTVKCADGEIPLDGGER